MRSYLDAWRVAAERRRRTTAPPVLGKALTLFAMVGLALVLAIFLRRSGRSIAYNFGDQRGVVTVLSALLLAMGGAFSFAAASVGRNQGRRTAMAWSAFAAGLTYLAADELLQFNLWLGIRLDRRLPLPPGVHAWDDMVVVAYGAVAVLVGLWALPTILAQPRVGRFLTMASGFYVLHTALDMFGHGRIAVIFEESAKVFSGACLLLAAYVGLLTIAGEGGKRTAPDS